MSAHSEYKLACGGLFCGVTHFRLYFGTTLVKPLCRVVCHPQDRSLNLASQCEILIDLNCIAYSLVHKNRFARFLRSRYTLRARLLSQLITSLRMMSHVLHSMSTALGRCRKLQAFVGSTTSFTLWSGRWCVMRRSCCSSAPLPLLHRANQSKYRQMGSAGFSSSRVIMKQKPSKQAQPNELIENADNLKPSQESLVALINKKTKDGAVRKIVTVLEETEAGTGDWGVAEIRPDAITYRTAIRSLLKLNRTDLAIHVYRMRMEARTLRPSTITSDLPLSTSVIRAILRDVKNRKARGKDRDDVFSEMMADCATDADTSLLAKKQSESNPAKHVGAMLHVMNAFLIDGDNSHAVQALKAVFQLPIHDPAAALPVKDYNNCIRLLGKSKLLSGVFAILDLMRASNVQASNETFEFLANAAVRQVNFITGAVSMNTLPPPIATEVAFAGRSNVGKSSLVNMLCNRKALAYVSGTPGKTQQFNYFHVNEKEEESQFYMVDLPGVGYAKVPKSVQNEWIGFMEQYLQFRTSLRMIFHLIDGRHGAMADDEHLMRLVAASGRQSNEYVIVFTKMDKMDKQKLKQAVMKDTRAALCRNGCRLDTPMVLTSSSSRLGRDEMWRHLQSVIVSSPLEISRSSLPNQDNC